MIELEEHSLMHVLYLIDSLAPGGAESSLAALAPSLVRRGVQLDIAYLKDVPGLHRELTDAGAELFSLDGPSGRLGWTRRAISLVRNRKPDLIHTTLADSNVVGRLAGVATGTPVACSLVSIQYGPDQASDPNVLRWRMKVLQTVNAITARSVVRFHAVSRDVADVMSKRLLVPRTRVEVIPRGRDLATLGKRTAERRHRARAGLRVSSEQKILFTAARHEHAKRLELLVEALPLVLQREPSAMLVIAGREGNASEELRSAIARLGIGEKVQILGPRGDVPDLMCAADAFALPSRREGFPGVLAEAMALELPIVATDLPGVREVVEGPDVAWLVSKASPRDFADAIIAALGTGPDVRTKTELGRGRFLERFTIEQVADEMVGFYGRALAGRGAHRRRVHRPIRPFLNKS